MFSTCSWIASSVSNAQSVYSAARFLYSAVSATAYIGSMSSSVSAALESRGKLYARSSALADVVVSLQQLRDKDKVA